MKKPLALIAALCLCVSAAVAETSVTARTLDVPGEDTYVSMDYYSGVLLVQDNTAGVRWLADGEMNRLSDDYADISIWTGGYFKVYTEAGMNGCGLLNAKGDVLVPAEYADTKGFSDRWSAGYVLADATVDDYDYRSYGLNISDRNREYFVIDRVDVYYAGQKAGSFSRDEWGDAQAYGDYLRVRDRKGYYHWYSREMVQAESTDLSEYYQDGEQVIHSGSGQAAFTPGCTLTEDEVKRAVWLTTDSECRLLDLKGSVLADFSSYNSAWFATDDLIQITGADGKKGLADLTGKELVPCAYDELLPGNNALRVGYTRAVKDGKEGFVSLATGAETGFAYDAFSGNSSDFFIIMQDPEKEDHILISAAAGELPEHYPDVTEYDEFAIVRKADDTVHLIGQRGEDILPGDAILPNDIVSLNQYGTQCLVSHYDEESSRYVYTLYTIAYDAE